MSYHVGQCVERQLRLANGTSQYEGRVEVCIGGVWGTIGDTAWDFISAGVICRLAGFSRPGKHGVSLALSFSLSLSLSSNLYFHFLSA